MSGAAETSAFLSLVLLAGGTSPAEVPVSPYSVFEYARTAWSAQRYPAVFHYGVTVHVTEGTKDELEHFQSESQNGDVRVLGVSDEEQAHPRAAKGVNFKISLSIGWNEGSGGKRATYNADAHRVEASADYLGRPVLNPNYSFGLDAAQDVESPDQRTADETTLPTIATVTSQTRAYDISFANDDSVDSAATYHLRLVPRRAADRYRLRQLWIDKQTYRVVKLEISGNFINAPMKDVPWIVTFRNVDGETYIDSETAESPLTFKHNRVFTSATISFDHIESGGMTIPVLPEMNLLQTLREP